jgi:subtilisin family serine protease
MEPGMEILYGLRPGELVASSRGESIYRLPPMVLGAEILTAQQIDDIIDWGLEGNKLVNVWPESGKGEGVKVAILDTGRPDHKDLPDPIFAHNFSRSATDLDRVGHATHVAGTLGARENGTGVIGVAPLCQIGYCKVLGDDGSGTSDAIARGIYRAIDEGVHIISMSLGGGFDRGIADACLNAVQAGIFVICAAGNDGANGNANTIGWPARLPYTVAIASYNRDGKISQFSSRGPEVDAAFPGEDILSCWLNQGFRRISGTSMATPFASGLTANMLSYQARHTVDNPVRNNADWKKRVEETGQDQGPQGKDNAWGWGIPDPMGFVRGRAASPAPVPGDGERFKFGSLNVEILNLPDGRSGPFLWVD